MTEANEIQISVHEPDSLEAVRERVGRVIGDDAHDHPALINGLAEYLLEGRHPAWTA